MDAVQALRELTCGKPTPEPEPKPQVVPPGCPYEFIPEPQLQYNAMGMEVPQLLGYGMMGNPVYGYAR